MSNASVLTIGVCLFFYAGVAAQKPAQRELPAKKTVQKVTIDGQLNEPAWQDAAALNDLIEFRPTMGAREAFENRTEAWLMYDDRGIYFGGYCHERSRDSIARELAGRDGFGTNDYVGLIVDTYNDKLNGFEYFVTPLNEQWDSKMNEAITNGQMEDFSWNAVWESQAVIHEDGWSFEMFIPYSAIRFSARPVQDWGINITRRRRKTEQQYTWNPIDVKVKGFMSQEGKWTGLANIKPPVRLQLSPYFSVYANHYPYHQAGVKDWTSQVNGGLDLKYGLNQALTLDVTLVPDFGQVQSDNQVLNLTPFEVKYNENRPFFTEGTELFTKGNLFYSRRIGGSPLHQGDISDQLGPNEQVIKNPLETRLINASKISGRSRSGLGIGVFNAVTRKMEATVENTVTGEHRKVQTSPLTNYNIVVLDQTLKNNSSVSFINTNVWRNGRDYDANVSAGLFSFNDKTNRYGVNGKVAVSQLIHPGQTIAGYSHELGFGKTGRWSFRINEELVDRKYDINDMGILFNNNYLDHYLWTSYRWVKPTNWYNRIQVNYNLYYSRLFSRVDNQKLDTRFQTVNTNVNANMQLKNLWFVGMFVGYVPSGNDFYEPRVTGYSFRTPTRFQFNPWFETNGAKKYSANFNYFVGLRQWNLFSSPNQEFELGHRYRFSDHLSVAHSISYNPVRNDAGFYSTYYENGPGGTPELKDIIFSRRDRTTIENILSVKYSFSNRSGVTIRLRHYWSQVEVKQLYDLLESGELRPSNHTAQVAISNKNFNIFNVDAVYTLQFAPGSFLNLVWKDQSASFDDRVERPYFSNLGKTVSGPQNNNLSLKIIYFLDYLSLRKGKHGDRKG